MVNEVRSVFFKHNHITATNPMKALILATAFLSLTFATQAFAEDIAHTDRIYFAVGHYDILEDTDAAFDFRAEYRFGTPVWIDHLKPWIGAEITSDTSAWAGGGLLYDWNFAPDWYLTPMFGVGLYAQGSSDLDLDHPIQFRSQLEASYEYNSGVRAGLAFSHISNAGISDDNVGTEVLNLSVSYPF